jgi:signal peptidase I
MTHTQRRATDEPRRRSILLELPVLLVGALLIAIVLKTFVIQPFWIPSESMRETLQIGDRVLVWKPSYVFGEVERGDVVVFRRGSLEPEDAVDVVKRSVLEAVGVQSPGSEDLIKRVIGLQGESVEIRRNQVLIDGDPIDEPYVSDPEMADMEPIVVEPDTVFVMGDHRCAGCSQDSRVFGTIGIDDVLGRAVAVFWPVGDLGGL